MILKQTVNELTICPTCRGMGKLRSQDKSLVVCDDCGGIGKVMKFVTIEFKKIIEMESVNDERIDKISG